MIDKEPQTPSASAASPSITTLGSREIYRNQWMRLREDDILRSNGKRGIYGVVEKDEAAIIIPIESDRVWLVEQFRYTIQMRAWELPQGGWERAIDNPEELARGELREELGINAERMTCLGSTWIAYGFTRQKQHVYLATGLTHGTQQLDPEEHDLVVRSVPIAEFEQMMFDGVIRDSSTLAAWALYLLWKSRR
ncbi:MAG TPA: NUDIX hydrolase [Terracidiphilus sp.]